MQHLHKFANCLLFLSTQFVNVRQICDVFAKFAKLANLCRMSSNLRDLANFANLAKCAKFLVRAAPVSTGRARYEPDRSMMARQ